MSTTPPDIPPAAAAVLSSAQRYRGETMVLETEFSCAGGVALVVDFMPNRNPSKPPERAETHHATVTG